MQLLKISTMPRKNAERAKWLGSLVFAAPDRALLGNPYGTLPDAANPEGPTESRPFVLQFSHGIEISEKATGKPAASRSEQVCPAKAESHRLLRCRLSVGYDHAELPAHRFRPLGMDQACHPCYGDNVIRHLGDAVFIVATR